MKPLRRIPCMVMQQAEGQMPARDDRRLLDCAWGCLSRLCPRACVLHHTHEKPHRIRQFGNGETLVDAVDHPAFFPGQAHAGKAVYMGADALVMARIAGGDHQIGRYEHLRIYLPNRFAQGGIARPRHAGDRRGRKPARQRHHHAFVIHTLP